MQLPKLLDFKKKFEALLRRRKFNPLFERKAKEGSAAWKYLESRKIDPKNLEFYDFNGNFVYNGKEYTLPNSIVIPLRDANGVLKGVWIRFLEEKRFFIWMCDSSFQKYWLQIEDPNAPVFLAESIFDALSAKQLLGAKNVAACLGVKASKELQGALQDFEVVMCFDNDVAGYKGMLSHLNAEETSHWKIVEIPEFQGDLMNHKDYNSVINAGIQELNHKIKAGISAKVYIKNLI